MRRRRKKNSGLRWTIALIVVGVLGYVGLQYWKGHLPIKPPAQHAAPTAATVVQPVPLPPPTPATVARAATPTATFMDEAEARDAAARAAREQTLQVQQRLRQDNRERTQAADKPAQDERCVNGQRMKRVANGWVQAGGDCPGAVAAPELAPQEPQQQAQPQPQQEQQQQQDTSEESKRTASDEG